jgi:hypothetical protein
MIGRQANLKDAITKLTQVLDQKPVPQNGVLEAIKEFDNTCKTHAPDLKDYRKDLPTLKQIMELNERIVGLYIDTIHAVTREKFEALKVEHLHDFKRARSFKALVDLANILQQYVLDSIAANHDPILRSLVIERFIRIANRLHRANNFFAAQMIVSTLMGTQVANLYKEKNALSADCRDLLDGLEQIYNPLLNSSRNFLDRTVKPALGAKMPNIVAVLNSIHAKNEGSLLHATSEQGLEIKKCIQENCVSAFKELYVPYLEPIEQNRVCVELKNEIVSANQKRKALLSRRLQAAPASKIEHDIGNLKSKISALNIKLHTADETTKKDIEILKNQHLADIQKLNDGLKAINERLSNYKAELEKLQQPTKQNLETLKGTSTESSLVVLIGNLVGASPEAGRTTIGRQRSSSSPTSVVPDVVQTENSPSPASRARLFGRTTSAFFKKPSLTPDKGSQSDPTPKRSEQQLAPCEPNVQKPPRNSANSSPRISVLERTISHVFAKRTELGSKDGSDKPQGP